VAAKPLASELGTSVPMPTVVKVMKQKNSALAKLHPSSSWKAHAEPSQSEAARIPASRISCIRSASGPPEGPKHLRKRSLAADRSHFEARRSAPPNSGMPNKPKTIAAHCPPEVAGAPCVA